MRKSRKLFTVKVQAGSIRCRDIYMLFIFDIYKETHRLLHVQNHLLSEVFSGTQAVTLVLMKASACAPYLVTYPW